jgi:hypothetical protein
MEDPEHIPPDVADQDLSIPAVLLQPAFQEVQKALIEFAVLVLLNGF